MSSDREAPSSNDIEATAKCADPPDTEDGAVLPTLPLTTGWSWYAHTDSQAGYDAATVKFGDFDTFNEFFRYYNNVPTPDRVFMGDAVLYLPTTHGGCCVTGYAIFRQVVMPMWEDPRNAKGRDLCARTALQREDLAKLWLDLTISLVNEEIGDNVLGIRVAHRTDRRTGATSQKIEIWLSDLETSEAMTALGKLLHIKLDYSVVNHTTVTTVQQRPVKRDRRRGRARDDGVRDHEGVWGSHPSSTS